MEEERSFRCIQAQTVPAVKNDSTLPQDSQHWQHFQSGFYKRIYPEINLVMLVLKKKKNAKGHSRIGNERFAYTIIKQSQLDK